jgi:hypothetical protein
MIWGDISWKFGGPIISLRGRINSRDYLRILEEQVHSMVQAMFSDGNVIFEDDNAPIQKAVIIKKLHEEHSHEVERLIVHYNHQT